jgi:[acyl-carrier-protein] S-malonyltransferase
LKKTAYLFPGQGSQAVGMGLDFYQEFDVVRELFDMMEEISRINISKLCFKGPLEDLTATVNLQPAITGVNLACLTAIKKAGIGPTLSAGHSLGEYSALCASGIVSREDTFRLVFKRGELMHREATRNKGAMHAIIGLPINTGAPEPVKRVSDLAVSQGAKAIPLKVSGAWHSDLIQGAQDEFKDVIESIRFNTPEKPMVFNVTADVESDTKEIKSIMARQLCSPVKWYDSMCRLMAENIENFVEVGPGRVLAGLLKKILPKDYPRKIYNVNSMRSLDRFLNETM